MYDKSKRRKRRHNTRIGKLSCLKRALSIVEIHLKRKGWKNS